MRFLLGIVTTILLGLSGWFVPPLATADIVVFKDRTKAAVYGRIVSQSDSTTTIAVVSETDAKLSRRKEISNDQIELVVRNFDERRLAELSSGSLADYQNYAIELATQQVDPVARDTAVRLHMIVVDGVRDNQPLGRSMKLASLRQLVEIARNEKERSEFELLLKLEVGGENTDERKSGERIETLIVSQADNAAVVRVIQLLSLIHI